MTLIQIQNTSFDWFIFPGFRLSFAVKLSVNPVVARLKMWKQEFTHEEYMHQSTLALLKYYNVSAIVGCVYYIRTHFYLSML